MKKINQRGERAHPEELTFEPRPVKKLTRENPEFSNLGNCTTTT
jgi:hypothetical protein